jgi:hypothetical protein
MSEMRQVKTVTFNEVERIFMWSLSVDGSELHAIEDSRQDGDDEATQNKKTNS